MKGIHPDFASNIIQSEIEGGVRMDDVTVGSTIKVKTRSRLYIIQKTSDKTYTIEGHPEYCSVPTKVRIDGSSWGGASLKKHYIGIGMMLEFYIDGYPGVFRSRVIESVEVI
jgi:hypothetical protein